MCSAISFQLTSLFQFSTCESTIANVIVGLHALNWNKLVNWNNMEEQIQFQLEALPIFSRLFSLDYCSSNTTTTSWSFSPPGNHFSSTVNEMLNIMQENFVFIVSLYTLLKCKIKK